MQSRWLVQLMLNRTKLPDETEMLQDIDKDQVNENRLELRLDYELT